MIHALTARGKYNPPQKPSDPDTNHLVKPLRTDNLELEREQ